MFKLYRFSPDTVVNLLRPTNKYLRQFGRTCKLTFPSNWLLNKPTYSILEGSASQSTDEGMKCSSNINYSFFTKQRTFILFSILLLVLDVEMLVLALRSEKTPFPGLPKLSSCFAALQTSLLLVSFDPVIDFE